MIKNKLVDYIQRIWYYLWGKCLTIGLRFYCRRWQVANYPKLNRSEPVIYVSNHQNAFLDALVIIFSQTKHPIFLTRANIFANPIARFFLRSWNMFPIYRSRDGGDAVKRNEAVINDCIDILSVGRQPLSIFAEGNHSMKRSLRPFKKGPARIAFSALEQMNFEKELKVIPIGITYSKHTRVRANVLLNFGEPLIVNKYKSTYDENPNKAYIALTDELHNQVEKLIINIDDQENYEEIEKAWIREKTTFPSLVDELHNDQKIIARLKQEKAEGRTLNTAFERKKKSLIGWVLGFPAFIYGTLNHLPLIFLLNRLLGKVVTDIHFYGSIKLAAGTILGMFLYLSQAIGVYSLTGGNTLIAILYFVTMPFFGIFAYDYFQKYYSDEPHTTSSAELLKGYK
jgi:1-acyl-sn-glycerol-3-phosphate acyltransferase